MVASSALLLNTFTQANTIRGWRYLDRTGVLLNRYEAEFREKQVGPDGTTLTNPAAQVRQMVVSWERVWVHVEEPDTLTFAADQSWKLIQEACKTFEVTSLSRVGIRMQHAVPAKDLATLIGQVSERTFTPGVAELVRTGGGTPDEAPADPHRSAFTLSLPLRSGKLRFRLQLLPVVFSRETPKTRDLPADGLVLDVDAYQEGELSLVQGRGVLREIERWTSRELPEVMGTFFGEEI